MSRSRTIWITPLVGLISLGVGLACAQEGGAGKAVRKQGAMAKLPAPRITMQQLLQLWEGQSAKLRTLEIQMYRVDKDPKWGDEEHYLAHAAFKSPQLAYIDFRKVALKLQPDPNDKQKKRLAPVIKDNKPVSVPYETLVCTGEEVWQYRYPPEQKVYIYPLDKDQRKRALEEGPLPFLFNMRAAEAMRRYAMQLTAEYENAYLVRVKPLLESDQSTFSHAWIYLEKEGLLPTRIVLLGPDGQSTKDFTMTQIHANQPVKESYFKGVNPNNFFKVIRNPGGADVPAQAGGRRRLLQDRNAKRPAAAGAADGPR